MAVYDEDGTGQWATFETEIDHFEEKKEDVAGGSAASSHHTSIGIGTQTSSSTLQKNKVRRGSGQIAASVAIDLSNHPVSSLKNPTPNPSSISEDKSSSSIHSKMILNEFD